MTSALDLPSAVILALCWVVQPTLLIMNFIHMAMEWTAPRREIACSNSWLPEQCWALQNVGWGIAATPPGGPGRTGGAADGGGDDG